MAKQVQRAWRFRSEPLTCRSFRRGSRWHGIANRCNYADFNAMRKTQKGQGKDCAQGVMPGNRSAQKHPPKIQRRQARSNGVSRLGICQLSRGLSYHPVRVLLGSLRGVLCFHSAIPAIVCYATTLDRRSRRIWCYCPRFFWVSSLKGRQAGKRFRRMTRRCPVPSTLLR